MTGVCAACDRPGHRYGTNEPERHDKIACINGLLSEVDDLVGVLKGIADATTDRQIQRTAYEALGRIYARQVTVE